MEATDGLVEAAEATNNPYMHSLALSATGLALVDADPVRALGALRRGLVIAQDSANRFTESILAIRLSALEAERRDLAAALEHVTLAIRNCHDSGNVTIIRNPLAILATLLDRLGRHESAATIAGFAFSPSPHRDPRPSARRSPTFATSSANRPTPPSPEMARHDDRCHAAYAYDQFDQAGAALRESA